MDQNGNEMDFVGLGGASVNSVEDMEVLAGQDLLITGNIQGVMIVDDGTPDLVGGSAFYGCYLLKLDQSCDYVAHSVIGSANPVEIEELMVDSNKAYVLGTFECQFTDLSNHYSSNGLFISTGAQDFWAAQFNLSDLGLLNGQQFGGTGNKYEGVLAQFQNGQIVVAGSFTETIVFPSDCGSWGEFHDPLNSACFAKVEHGGGTVCGDPSYGCFAGNHSSGGTDVFLGTVWLSNRLPYDVWNREDTLSCQFDRLEPCIYQRGLRFTNCADTVRVCGEANLHLFHDYFRDNSGANLSIAQRQGGTQTMGCIQTYQYGPPVDVLWNTGAQSNGITVLTSGWYVADYNINNCFSGTDSMYVIVDPYPPTPIVLTGPGYWPTLGQVCGDSLWLWHVPPAGVNYYWTLPNGQQLVQDSILAMTDGQYFLNYTYASGCEFSSMVPISFIATPVFPNITGFDQTVFYDPVSLDTLNGDTLYACEGEQVYLGVTYNWQVNGMDSILPSNVVATYFDGCSGISFIDPNQMLYICIEPTASGYYPFNAQGYLFSQSCPTDTLYFQSLSDSVFISVTPSPYLGFIGPTSSCPGDTIAIALFCFPCDSLAPVSLPSGAFMSGGNDSIFLTQPGMIEIDAYTINGDFACSQRFSQVISPSDVPLIFANTFAGAICPGDSVWMWSSSQGITYDWTGPFGSMGVNNDSVLVSDFGDYYLTVTDLNGCTQTVGPESVFPYSPPSLVAAPSAVVCDGDSINVFVTSPVANGVQWDPPLSGTSMLQVISAPGIYSCTVYFCNDSVDLAIELISSLAEAILLTPGPVGLCAGDTAQLSVVANGIDYDWIPGNIGGSTIEISSAGQYQVVVTDPAGCTDTSAVVYVTVDSITTPLSNGYVVACGNEPIWLSAGVNGTVNWYSGPDTSLFLSTGDSLLIEYSESDTSVYVGQYVGQCFDGPVQITVDFTENPVQLGNDTVICNGEVLQLGVSSDLTNIQWSTGSVTAAITVTNSNSYTVMATDTTGCTWTDTIQVAILDCMDDIPTVITPNGDGQNDVIQFDAGENGIAKVEVYNRWGQLVFVQESQVVTWNGRSGFTGELLSEGVYFLVIGIESDSNGVYSLKSYVHLFR
jgi:gliding motility-associated-like protein